MKETKFTVETVKEKLQSLFEKNKNIKFAIVFGSVAREDAFRFSDIDLAIYLEDYDGDIYKELSLEVEIAKLLRTDNFDLVILNDAPPALKYEIAVEGKVIFARDMTDYYFFYSLALREYFDFRYHLDKFHEKALQDMGVEKRRIRND